TPARPRVGLVPRGGRAGLQPARRACSRPPPPAVHRATGHRPVPNPRPDRARVNSLDQLLFTWQRGGFRPVAATGRLAAPSGWLAERARRLCRYDRPPGLGQNEKPPISYGWWTQGDTRWVFRRGYLGADPMGRPG